MSSQLNIARIQPMLHLKLRNANVKRWPPSAVPYYSHLSFFVIVCSQRKHATIASRKSANLILRSHFILSTLGSFHSTINPITTPNHFFHTKCEKIWINHSWISLLLRLRNQSVISAITCITNSFATMPWPSHGINTYLEIFSCPFNAW